MLKQKDQHIIDIVFVLSLFCVFAVLALFVVVLGANVYQSISGVMTENYNVRSSISYLTEKIHQGDSHGDIVIEKFGEGDALVLSQEIEGAVYETWIYLNEGSLTELMVPEGTEFDPESGQAIMELSDLVLESLDGRLFRITAVDVDGNNYDTMVSLKGTPTRLE
ncbi:DUF4860 domain-containing protein [Christensenellaceae bacterium OttesenSCG-928-K19]|nr:DUF4860 domain-containing protein [Christensenellaceae bacterium OttesenSCG-928-K19]